MRALMAVTMLFGLALLARPSHAATYYVNNQHPQAADTNPGTEHAPFKHIQAAADKVQPGDTILVKAGTYRECVVWKTPGTAQARMTLAAAPGETVVVKGSIVVKDWQKVTPAQAGLSGQYAGDNIWVKRDWERKNIVPADEPNADYRDGYSGGQGMLFHDRPRQAFWKDAPLEGAGRLAPAFQRWELEQGRIFHDREGKALYIWLPPGIEPNRDGIEVCVRPLFVFPGSKPDMRSGGFEYLTIRGFQIRHFGTRTLGRWAAVQVGGEDGLIVEDNTISWNDFEGLCVCKGKNAIVRRNTAAYNGIAGMGGNGDGHLIEDNLVIGNNVDNHTYWDNSGGGKWTYLTRTTFRRHKAMRNNGCGLWLDIECDDNVFEDCEFSHNAGPGLDIEISRRNLVRNCIFAFNTARPKGFSISARPLQDQRWLEDRAGGWGLLNRASEGTRVYHCLFFGNAEGGMEMRGGGRSWTEKDRQTGQDVVHETIGKDLVVMNNIFAENGVYQLAFVNPKKNPEAVGCKSDYNLFCGPQPVQNAELETWRKETGFEQHSIVAWPEITFGQAGFYEPPSTSRGVDAGTLVEECKVDINGTARPVGKAPDIGPFERATVLGAEHRPAIPSDLTFTPIDLGPLAKTEMSEWPVAGQGKDLKVFEAVLPKGADGRPAAATVTLAGVPFQIGYPKSVVAVPPLIAEETITIPMNRKADWLFFLETSAGVSPGRREVYYRVHYAKDAVQGKRTTDINYFTGGQNFSDYAADRPDEYFDRERGVNTAVAWQGKATNLSNIAIFRLAWPNSYPDVEITKIEVWRNRGRSAEHAILGLTSGSRR